MEEDLLLFYSDRLGDGRLLWCEQGGALLQKGASSFALRVFLFNKLGDMRYNVFLFDWAGVTTG